MTKIRYTIIIIIILSFLLIVPAVTQDAEATDEPIPTGVLPGATPTPTSVISSHTPTPTASATSTATPTLMPMATISSTVMVDVSGTQVMTSVPTFTLTLSPSLTLDAESTAELTPISATATEPLTVTGTPTSPIAISTTMTATEAVISTPISGVMPTVGPTLTSISPTIVNISPTLTSMSSTITPTIMPTVSGTHTMIPVSPTVQPTATIGGLPLRFIQGIARYQNHVTDDAGIQVQIFDDDLTLVSDVVTNADGIYNVAVPLDSNFWIQVSAWGHRTDRIYITDSEAPPEFTLLAGDLNDDECINFDDLRLIQVDAEVTPIDLNDDGIIDLADVALLAGNLKPACVVTVEPTATISPTPDATPVLSETPSIATESVPTPLDVVSATATIEITITSESIAETTEEP